MVIGTLMAASRRTTIRRSQLFPTTYNWLNQWRLPGAENSCFLVWFEGHRSALAIGPSIPCQTESESEADLAKLLSWLL
jgi:hypothetical protein